MQMQSNADYDNDEPGAYVELELDINDVRAISKAISFSLHGPSDNVDTEDDFEERLIALENFIQKIILEYNYKVD
jgi:hypothetical protein